MIVLDTHVWLWWVHDHPSLMKWMRDRILDEQSDRIGISVISCWEVAKLVSLHRVDLGGSIDSWIADALGYPGIETLSLTPSICIDANNLPGTFHRDPADQIIVATARALDCELLTSDARILAYPEVRLAKPPT